MAWRKRDRADKGEKKLLLVLALLALACNLLLLYLYYHPRPKLPRGDETFYLLRAAELAAGVDGRWFYPFWPPLYFHFLAGLFSLFGKVRLAPQLIQVAMWAATAYLWYGISFILSGKRFLARTVFVLFLFYPDLMAYSHYFWP